MSFLAEHLFSPLIFSIHQILINEWPFELMKQNNAFLDSLRLTSSSNGSTNFNI